MMSIARCHLAVIFGCVSALFSGQLRAEKPNIVIILADDMGYGDVSAYNQESKIKTPHLDRMAREGMRFTDAHSGGSSCIPSRYALMTGRFAVRRSMGLSEGSLIEPERMTIASMLRGQGYRTAMVGKWHLGFDPYLQNAKAPADYNKPLKGGPVDCGFDSFFGMHASLDLPPYFYIRGCMATSPPTGDIEHHDNVGEEEGWNQIQGAFWRKGKIAPDFDMEQVTPRLFSEACKLIKNHAGTKNNKPLFLYLALPSPHTPWLPLEKYRGKSGAGMYGDFVLQVDDGVGEVIAALKSAGMADHTLVIFSSDNGPVWYDKDREKFGHDSVGGLRGMKFSSHEGGHRMPFIARWPAKVPAASVSAQPVVFSDLLATCTEITGQKNIPEGMAEDSISFHAHLVGDKVKPEPRPAIVHDRKTIRSGDWKLILPGMHGRKQTELYKLSEDPGETQNLYAAYPNIVSKLTAHLSGITNPGKP